MVQETARAVNRKSRTGTVVSDVNDKTIIVEIVRQAPHRLYRKVIRRTKRYHVHDPENQATVGDIVRIEECRPISKTKRWQLSAVLTERQVADVAPEELDEGLIEEIQGTSVDDASAEAADQTPVSEAAPVDEPAADVEAEAPADAAEEKAD